MLMGRCIPKFEVPDHALLMENLNPVFGAVLNVLSSICKLTLFYHIIS